MQYLPHANGVAVSNIANRDEVRPMHGHNKHPEAGARLAKATLLTCTHAASSSPRRCSRSERTDHRQTVRHEWEYGRL